MHMRIKPGKLSCRLTAIVLMLFCSIAQPEKFTIQYVTASDEIFAEPHDIVLSPDGEQLYVADNGNDLRERWNVGIKAHALYERRPLEELVVIRHDSGRKALRNPTRDGCFPVLKGCGKCTHGLSPVK